MPARSDPLGQRRPPSVDLFLLWLGIGLKSVGGGQAVQFYAYESLVNERKWLTYEGWTQSWGLSQVVPGVNVIAVAALTGLRMVGLSGALASLLGLMLPSVVATAAIAAVYTRISHLPGVAPALHGMFIAVAGAALVLNWRVGRPLFTASRRRGWLALITCASVPVVSAVLIFTGSVSVPVVLVGSATIVALTWARSPAGR